MKAQKIQKNLITIVMTFNSEELDHDSDDIQFVILGIVIGLGIAGLITYRRFKR